MSVQILLICHPLSWLLPWLLPGAVSLICALSTVVCGQMYLQGLTHGRIQMLDVALRVLRPGDRLLLISDWVALTGVSGPAIPGLLPGS
ncbi:MAG TPA: hypothetical protein VGF67_21690 [Ktedonobacteraceae bacterium]|jgi:hypothetical protein